MITRFDYFEITLISGLSNIIILFTLFKHRPILLFSFNDEPRVVVKYSNPVRNLESDDETRFVVVFFNIQDTF